MERLGDMRNKRLLLVVLLCCVSLFSVNAYAVPNPTRLIEKFAKSAGKGASGGKYYHKGFERAAEDYYYNFSRAGIPKSLEKLSKEKNDSIYWDSLSMYSQMWHMRSHGFEYKNINPFEYEGWYERYGCFRTGPLRVRSQQLNVFIEDVSECFVPYRCQIYADNMIVNKKDSFLEYKIDFLPNY